MRVLVVWRQRAAPLSPSGFVNYNLIPLDRGNFNPSVNRMIHTSNLQNWHLFLVCLSILQFWSFEHSKIGRLLLTVLLQKRKNIKSLAEEMKYLLPYLQIFVACNFQYPLKRKTRSRSRSWARTILSKKTYLKLNSL